MKLSNKQAMILFEIAKGTLTPINICGPIGGYLPEQRERLINEILNQQSDTLVDLEAQPHPTSGESGR